MYVWSVPSNANSFPHPYVAVDLVVLTWRETPNRTLGAELLLGVVERTDEPPTGWALPGAYVQDDENTGEAVARVFTDKLGLPAPRSSLPLPPFSEVDRDSRRRTVSLPAIVLLPKLEAITTDTHGWARMTLDEGGRLTRLQVGDEQLTLLFDHMEILDAALTEVQRRLAADDLGFMADFLPDRFALRELERAWNILTGSPANTASFRRRMSGFTKPSGEPWLELTDEMEEGVGRRAARLYRWT